MNAGNLDFEKVDLSNQFGVGRAGNGEMRIHWSPTEAPIRLSRAQMLNLIAWGYLLADVKKEELERLVELIQSV